VPLKLRKTSLVNSDEKEDEEEDDCSIAIRIEKKK
jgi:hypothetical protein